MGRPKRIPLTPKLADHRRRLGLTQDQVAERLGITADMVRRHERGISTPSSHNQAGYCTLYSVDEVTLGFRPLTVKQTLMDPPDGEDVAAILERVITLEATSVGSTTLALLQTSIDDFVNRYEDEGPKVLVRPLTGQRIQIESLMNDCRHPDERCHLYKLAGRTSALLAYMAVNRSRYPLARAYCTEAFALATHSKDRELQAWVRGTQSFCEYYAGEYQAAIDYARDGYQYAQSGPQAVRLALNGEARALGKMGDRSGVHAAVDRGYELLEANPVVPGVSPCISFGGYSLARAASNAVTAYVDLGAPSDASKHAGIAMPEFETSDSKWSQSLIRLDLAKALVLDLNGDPEEATGLVRRALNLASENPITSVVQRSRDFLRVSRRRWNDVPAVLELCDEVSSAQVS